MSQGSTASAPYIIKKGVYPVGMVRSPQSTESSSSTQCVLDSLRDCTNLGLMPLIGHKVHAVISDDTVGDAVTVYNPGYKVYHRSEFGRLNRLGFYPFGELIHHDQ